MREIHAGIAYEGGEDGEIIASIVRRIAEEKNLTFDHFVSESPHTAIVEMAGIYAKRFSKMNFDIGIFCTDQDKAPKSRTSEIREKIQASAPEFLDKSAIGVPIPHIEAWLLLDEDLIKEIFNLNGSSPVPYPEMSPKDRLTRLYSESPIDDELESEVRVRIAKRMNIRRCCQKDRSFNSFINEIRRALSTVC